MTVPWFLCLLTYLSVACGDVCVLPRTDGDELFSTQPQAVNEELCDRIDGECVSLNVSDIGVLPGYNASVTCPACKCINNGSFHPSTLQCTYDCVFFYLFFFVNACSGKMIQLVRLLYAGAMV